MSDRSGSVQIHAPFSTGEGLSEGPPSRVSPRQGEVPAGPLRSAQLLFQAFGEDRVGPLAGKAVCLAGLIACFESWNP